MASKKKFKPKIKSHKLEYFHWHDLDVMIQKVSGRDPRNWNKGDEYDDFWHWVCERNDISNCGLIYMNFEEIVDDDYEGGNEPWVKEIAKVCLDIVGPGDHTFMTDW